MRPINRRGNSVDGDALARGPCGMLPNLREQVVSHQAGFLPRAQMPHSAPTVQSAQHEK